MEERKKGKREGREGAQGGHGGGKAGREPTQGRGSLGLQFTSISIFISLALWIDSPISAWPRTMT